MKNSSNCSPPPIPIQNFQPDPDAITCKADTTAHATMRRIWQHERAILNQLYKRAWKFMTFCHVQCLPQLFKWKLHFSISWMSSSRFVHVIHGMSAARNFSHPEQFLHGRNLFAQKPLSTKTTIHNSFYRQSVFTQKILRTEVLRTEGFTHSLFYIQTILHADVFTQTQIAHRNLCTQYAFTHNQLLHRQVLFPLLDHLPFVSPFQVKNFWQ